MVYDYILQNRQITSVLQICYVNYKPQKLITHTSEL